MSLLDGDPWLALSGELSPSSEEPPITHGEHKGQASHPAPWSDSAMGEGYPANVFLRQASLLHYPEILCPEIFQTLRKESRDRCQGVGKSDQLSS